MGQNPFFTDYMYFPTLANLSLHTLTFTNSIFAFILSPFLSEIEVLNILQLGSICLAGVSMVALVKYLTGNKFAGLISGVIFAFSPYFFSHLLTGHYNLSFIWMVPFLVLFFLKSLHEDNIYNPIIFSVLLLAQSYQDLQTALFAGIILLIIFIFYAIAMPKQVFCKRRLTFLGCFVAIFGLGYMLPYIMLVKEFWGNRGLWQTYNNGDLLVLFSNNPLNPFWGAGVFTRVEGMIGGFRENTISLGYAAMAMAILTVASARHYRKKIMFFAILLVGIILALGPNLQIAGNQINGVILPFYYLAKLPIFSIGVVPTRFILIAYFALAVLAGYFINDLKFLLQGPRIKYVYPLVIIVFAVAVGLEYYSGPMSINVLPHSSALQALKEVPDKENVLVALPRQRCGYDQMVFNKKIVGGCLGRRINGFYLQQYNSDPGINLIISGKFDQASPADFNRESVILSAKKYNIGYIVADKTIQEQGELDSVRKYLEVTLGLKTFAEDASTVVYRI
jgi:hypothetical protein